MQRITPAELLKRFNEVKQATIVTVVMNTEVELLKKSRVDGRPCEYVGIRKRTTCQAMVGTDYENGVNNRKEKEGQERDFQAEPHRWADHTDKPVISTNKDGTQYYANIRVIKTLGVEYECDGKEFDRELIREFEKKKSPSSRQGVADEVIWRMPKVYPACSIEKLKYSGEEIEVVQ
jgi:hypothetical protein